MTSTTGLIVPKEKKIVGIKPTEKKEEKGQIKIKLQQLENEINSKQMDINLADAKSTATGIGGIMQRSWRPLIGMSCALAILWEFVLKQFIMFGLAAFSIEHAPLPELDMSTLFPLVTALLGMSGLRSWEKSKKLTK